MDFILYHGQYFRHGEEVKCYKPLSGSMENMAIIWGCDFVLFNKRN